MSGRLAAWVLAGWVHSWLGRWLAWLAGWVDGRLVSWTQSTKKEPDTPKQNQKYNTLELPNLTS